ncbi:unnamed protein product [Orchesella dallaii]|uniref:Uncharacterized protein n=1 Tax=Orchesella dallaii TaxID=48710 RepID=A0ABP1SAK6_9HEXA
MNYSKSILCGAALCCILFSLTNGAAVINKEEHGYYFKNLTLDEQEALIALAIAHHDVPGMGQPGIYPISPLVRPTAQEIPSRLFQSMINGDVPTNFLTKFIQWLKDDFGITDATLNKYRQNETENVCQEDGGRCFSLNDLGAQCCPFG